MSLLAQKAREFAKLYPNRPPSRSSGTWDQLCGLLMVQFGAFLGGATANDMIRLPTSSVRPFWKVATSGDISSAYRASLASRPLTANATLAPVGAFHFFDIGGAANGHVGIDLEGGGYSVFMATSALREVLGAKGSSLGINSVAGYTAAKKATYLGWSMNYAGGQIYIPQLAATERQVLATASVNRRAVPNLTGEKLGSFPAGSIQSPNGWVTGETVNGVSTWFYDGAGYSWAGGYTDSGTHDLTDLTPPPVPDPTPIDPDPRPIHWSLYLIVGAAAAVGGIVIALLSGGGL